MPFVMPPFWAIPSSRATFPHAISVRVEPAVVIVSASLANPTVITTATAHGYVSGDTVSLLGITGSTPAVDGSRVVTVITPTSFSVPVNVTGAGTGGTSTRTLPVEPLTLTEGKLRAGLDWVSGDARDALMTGFIAAARSKVEQDTGLALLSQFRDIYLDRLSGSWVTLPAQSLPLQSVTSITSIDTAAATQTLATTQYVVDLVSGRIGLALGGSWPTDLRPFQPITIRILAGYSTIATIPPLLLHAVGLLTAHYATFGRDLASLDQIHDVPYGYQDVIAPYSLVTVA